MDAPNTVELQAEIERLRFEVLTIRSHCQEAINCERAYLVQVHDRAIQKLEGKFCGRAFRQREKKVGGLRVRKATT